MAFSEDEFISKYTRTRDESLFASWSASEWSAALFDVRPRPCSAEMKKALAGDEANSGLMGGNRPGVLHPQKQLLHIALRDTLVLGHESGLKKYEATCSCFFSCSGFSSQQIPKEIVSSFHNGTTALIELALLMTLHVTA